MDNATMTDARLQAARTTLASRMAALEDRVTGTIEGARAAVDETTTTVRETFADVTGNVRGMVGDVSDNVRGLVGSASENIGEALDVRQRMREHPLAGTLLAVGAGLAAWLITRPKPGSRISVRTATGDYSTEPAGPFGEIYAAFRKELVSTGEAAAATAGKMLKEQLHTLTTGDGSQVSEYQRDRRAINSQY